MPNLAARYAFAPDFPLDARLEGLRWRYKQDCALGWSTPAQRRKAAERLAKLTDNWLAAASYITWAGGGYLVDEGDPEGLAVRMIQGRNDALAAPLDLDDAPSPRSA